MFKKKIKKQIFELKHKFYIDLWNEVLKKKNWKRKQSKLFLLRLERFFLFGFRPLKVNKIKKNLIKKKIRLKSLKLRNFYKNFERANVLNKKNLAEKSKFEGKFFLKKLYKLKRFIKLLELKKNSFLYKQLIFPDYFENYFNFFYINKFKKNFFKSLPLSVNNQLTYKNLNLFSKRFLPTYLWKAAFYAYYSRKLKKPRLKIIRRRGGGLVEKKKVFKSLLLLLGFSSKKKFFLQKKNFFLSKFKKSSSLYLNKLLLSILIKSNFFRKFRQIYIYIKVIGVLINYTKTIKQPYYYVKINKTISFPKKINLKLIKFYYNNLKNQYLFLNNWPNYFEISLKTLTIVLWREPFKNELFVSNSNYSNNLLQWF